jgi:hypothetical protein
MKYLIIIVSLFTLFTSCEKVIELNVGNVESKLVVEANINNLPGPYTVKLTKSVNFNSPNSYPVVSNALVIIADNTGVVDTLTYTTNGNYKTNILQGIPGRTYTLTIKENGTIYNATSTMPQPVTLDSLQQRNITFGAQNNKVFTPKYTDPISLGNNYYFVFFVNNQKYKSYFLWNDNTNNGLPNQRPILDGEMELLTGQQVKIEMRCLDLNTYNYFFTLSQIDANGPGGGTTPANPPSNISNGALGVFSVHTSSTKTKIVQ